MASSGMFCGKRNPNKNVSGSGTQSTICASWSASSTAASRLKMLLSFLSLAPAFTLHSVRDRSNTSRSIVPEPFLSKKEHKLSASSVGTRSKEKLNYQPLLDEHILDRMELAVLSCEIVKLCEGKQTD